MPSVAETSHVGRAARQVVTSPSESAPANAAELATVIAAAIDAGRPFSLRQARLTPWCLWSSDRPLARRPDYLNKILSVVAQSESPRPYRTLATAYVEAFAPDLPGLVPATQTLQELSNRWPDEPWSLLHRKFAIFDPGLGPSRLADEVINQDRPAPDILSDGGVRAMGARGGYTRAVTAELLRKLSDGAEPDHLGRLARAQKYAVENGRLIFDDLGDLFAAALLRPFGRTVPGTGVRDKILNGLLAVFDDPRLSSSGRKQSLRSPYREIAIGWLTEQSLRQFLDVVDRISREGMWAYRRAFWEGVYEYLRSRGVPINAWVAFGPVGEKQAQRSFGDRASFARLSQNGKYVEPTHAVLLMQIGDALVADWNENGKCHVWSSIRQPDCPKLFERTYDSAEVQIYYGRGHHETDTELTWGHGGSESLSWQRKIARRLSDILNVPIPQHVYELRRR
jgi:hypothetical protein